MWGGIADYIDMQLVGIASNVNKLSFQSEKMREDWMFVELSSSFTDVKTKQVMM